MLSDTGCAVCLVAEGQGASGGAGVEGGVCCGGRAKGLLPIRSGASGRVGARVGQIKYNQPYSHRIRGPGGLRRRLVPSLWVPFTSHIHRHHKKSRVPFFQK